MQNDNDQIQQCMSWVESGDTKKSRLKTVSPAAFGLRWNSYFHHDLWVAPKKSSIFCIHLRPKVARPKISNFCVGSDGNIRAENVSHPTREGCDGYVACKLTLSQVEKEQDNSLRTHGGHVYSLPFDPPFLPLLDPQTSPPRLVPFLSCSLTEVLSKGSCRNWKSFSPLHLPPGHGSKSSQGFL